MGHVQPREESFTYIGLSVFIGIAKQRDPTCRLLRPIRELASRLNDQYVSVTLTDQANVGAGSFYNLFDSKEAAVFEVVHEAIEAVGPWADSVCAFARLHGPTAAIVVVPRLIASRGVNGLPVGHAFWESTRLDVPPAAHGVYRDVFTGRRLEVAADGHVPLADVLADFPVALLGREP